MKRRTPEWWYTRLELVVGALMTILAVVVWLDLGAGSLSGEALVSVGPLSVAPPVVMSAVGLIVGWAWMLAIVRGLREESPPPWRYRHHEVRLLDRLSRW